MNQPYVDVAENMQYVRRHIVPTNPTKLDNLLTDVAKTFSITYHPGSWYPAIDIGRAYHEDRFSPATSYISFNTNFSGGPNGPKEPIIFFERNDTNTKGEWVAIKGNDYRHDLHKQPDIGIDIIALYNISRGQEIIIQAGHGIRIGEEFIQDLQWSALEKHKLPNGDYDFHAFGKEIYKQVMKETGALTDPRYKLQQHPLFKN
jgi:hypothetical protein